MVRWRGETDTLLQGPANPREGAPSQPLATAELTRTASAAKRAQVETVDNTALVLAEPDWKSIQERYLLGDDTRTIAEENGVTANAIYQRAYRNHWKEQQARHFEKNKGEIEREVRGCLTVSVLKDARAFQREDPPANMSERLTAAKARECLLATTARLFGWERDCADGVKLAKVIDI